MSADTFANSTYRVIAEDRVHVATTAMLVPLQAATRGGIENSLTSSCARRTFDHQANMKSSAAVEGYSLDESDDLGYQLCLCLDDFSVEDQWCAKR